MVVAHYFIDFSKCTDQGEDHTLQEMFQFLIFNLIMHHSVCWFVPLRVGGFIACTHTVNSEFRVCFGSSGECW